MKLIDKDVLKEEIRKRIRHLRNYEGAVKCLQALNDAPTIDAEPVRESEWYITETSLGEVAVMCGRCKAMQDRMSPYCPECGARTDMYEMENADDET